MKIVITGSGGRLGAALTREYSHNHEVTGFDHSQLDLGDPGKIRAAVETLDFDLLINAAAFTNVDLAEKEKEQAFRINRDAPRTLAEICRGKGAKLVHFSTDYVFDGEKRQPYREEDAANPVSAYGESKFAGETAVLDSDPEHLVVRVSWVFGPDRPSFVDQMIQRAREHDEIAAVADKWSTPSYTRDIADLLMRVVSKTANPVGAGGVLHIANTGRCTWQEYAQHALDCCREAGLPLNATRVGAATMRDMKTWIALRPVHSVLDTAKCEKLAGIMPRPWQNAVAEYVRDYVAQRGMHSP